MSLPQKSTIVRFKNGALRTAFRYGEYVAPGRMGRIARDLWFTAPPRMTELPVPEGGEPFEVVADGHVVRGLVWTPGGFETVAAGFETVAADLETVAAQPPQPPKAASVVYLMHGWGGRGSQFGAMVEPLVEAGHRVVMFDNPAHGDSDHGPAGPRRTNGLEFAKALDAVFCRFGPAEAVIAHSMGTISTYLALRFGWLGTRRLVLIAPMVESLSLFDAFQSALGFGRRTRRAFDRELLDWVGIPVAEFDARFQAAQVEPRQTLVITDKDDRQTPYDDVVDFAQSIQAPLITAEGLGHRKVLRDPVMVRTVLEFVTGERVLGVSA